MAKVTGLSRAQLTRLIGQFVKHGTISDRRGRRAKPFPRRYTEQDVRLLAEIDALHGTLSGPATRKLCERAYYRFAEMLAKLHIQQFTKSRPRRTNDNALVESKNGSVVRKHLGYAHIPAGFAEAVNRFTQHRLSPYLNFHRPSFFPTERVDARGRVRKHYRYCDMMTPYEKLKSLPGAENYLKPGTTFKQLDAIAHAISDNEAARRLNQARSELFETINNPQNPACLSMLTQTDPSGSSLDWKGL
ncbi:MAG: hypothetical protein WD397_13600 [Wenzhouxiangellaceae bacterium]